MKASTSNGISSRRSRKGGRRSSITLSRYHHGEMARVELPLQDLPRALEPQVRERLVEGLVGLGYRFVTLDLAGLRSGSLNPGL